MILGSSAPCSSEYLDINRGINNKGANPKSIYVVGSKREDSYNSRGKGEMEASWPHVRKSGKAERCGFQLRAPRSWQALTSTSSLTAATAILR